MIGLQHPYIGVQNGENVSYGGSQMFAEDKVMRECGCGIVGALDTLLYLGKNRPGCSVDFLPWDGSPIPQERYVALLQKLRRSYLPLSYPFGMNGLTLSAGLNRLFRRQCIPLHARWLVKKTELWLRMDQMLSRDIPVILSAGPNFPLLLSKKNKVAFCRRDSSGVLYPVTATNAHYVTVTGREGNWLRISSWGREYYLDKNTFTEYVEQHSSYIVSNILLLEERER